MYLIISIIQLIYKIFAANSKHINMPFTYSKGGKVTCKKFYMLWVKLASPFLGEYQIIKNMTSITIFSSDINYYSHIPFPSSFPPNLLQVLMKVLYCSQYIAWGLQKILSNFQWATDKFMSNFYVIFLRPCIDNESEACTDNESEVWIFL